jgi:ankyrin repeat protein
MTGAGLDFDWAACVREHRFVFAVYTRNDCLLSLYLPEVSAVKLRSSLLSVVLSAALAVAASDARGGNIHDAAREGDLERLRAILEESPSLVDSRDENGMTPLHLACRGVHVDVAGFLVAAGADVTATDDNGVTPLHSVAFRGNMELCRLFIDNGADIDATITGGTASIHLAVRAGHTGVVEVLLDSGAGVDTRDGLDSTPLLSAASYGHRDIAVILIERGADVGAANERGTTPLDAAHREGHDEIAGVLSERGARPGTADGRAPQGDYLGQPPPRLEPTLFAPGFVSTEQDQLNAVWTPDGDEFYFSRRGVGTRFVIMFTRRENERWTAPAAAPFCGSYAAVDHFMSYDGSRMYFCSDRPLTGAGDPKPDYDFWFVDRVQSVWGEPQHMGRVINSDKNDFYPTLTRDATVYFSSHRDGGMGQNDIYRSTLVGGAYVEPENLGEAINTEFAEFDPFIAPDESYVIFASGRPGGQGASDLYISFRRPDGSWSPAQNMGGDINSNQQDLTPMLSPDGAYLFFTSRRAGVSDLYWVDAGVIDRLRAGR